jgi:hypothetical protein
MTNNDSTEGDRWTENLVLQAHHVECVRLPDGSLCVQASVRIPSGVIKTPKLIGSDGRPVGIGAQLGGPVSVHLPVLRCFLPDEGGQPGEGS